MDKLCPEVEELVEEEFETGVDVVAPEIKLTDVSPLFKETDEGTDNLLQISYMQIWCHQLLKNQVLFSYKTPPN